MNPKPPSERQLLAERIYAYLVAADRFTAPYGVLLGEYTPKSGRGKARCVTFGFARTLDATLVIWSTTRLDLHTSRGDETFTSEYGFYKYCVENYNTQPPVMKG